MTEATWVAQNPQVIVTGRGDALDHAAAALVEKCGFPVRIAPEHALPAIGPRVVVFRDQVQLARLRRLLHGRHVTYIGMVPPPSLVARAGGHTVTWLGGDHIEYDLDALLRGTLGSPSGDERVEITPRELEVVGMYVTGSTAAETAATFFVAGSTVKTHYKRVSEKYREAGRPTDNSTQLLLEMMADGWITPPRRR